MSISPNHNYPQPYSLSYLFDDPDMRDRAHNAIKRGGEFPQRFIPYMIETEEPQNIQPLKY